MPSNQNTTYSIKLCTDIPKNSDPEALLDGRSPGHAFVELTKANGTNSVTEVIGFYPQNALKATTSLPVNSMIVNNECHPYDASLLMSVNVNQFNNMLNAAKEKAKNKYDMDDYNCTNYALDVFNAGRDTPFTISSTFVSALIPGTSQTIVMEYGKTPNGLYKKIKDMYNNKEGGASPFAGSGGKSKDCN